MIHNATQDKVERLWANGCPLSDVATLSGLSHSDVRRILDLDTKARRLDQAAVEAALEREKLCETARRWYRRETPPSWWRYKPEDYWPCVRANFADVLPEAA